MHTQCDEPRRTQGRNERVPTAPLQVLLFFGEDPLELFDLPLAHLRLAVQPVAVASRLGIPVASQSWFVQGMGGWGGGHAQLLLLDSRNISIHELSDTGDEIVELVYS
jgi:hypothetical protein